MEEVTRQDLQLNKDMADLTKIVYEAIDRVEAINDDEFLRHGDVSGQQEEDEGDSEL